MSFVLQFIPLFSAFDLRPIRTRHAGVWQDRLASDLANVDVARPESVTSALQAIELLKTDFVALVIRPKKYRQLLWLWVYTIVVVVVTYSLIGDESILSWCARNAHLGLISSLCNDTQGHLVRYIAFRYAAFGVLIGAALFGSLSSARAGFADPDAAGGMLTRPILRVVLSLAIAYVAAMLVASGKLSFNILGPDVSQDWLVPETKKDPGFRNAAALFGIGISAAIAAGHLFESPR